MELIEIFRKQDNETEADYRMRCYMFKQANPNITWKAITKYMNFELDCNHSESTYRKQAKAWLGTVALPIADESSPIEEADNYIYDLNLLLRELKKTKVQISDERSQNQAYIRKMSREETLLQIAREVADSMSAKKFLSRTFLPLTAKSTRVGIVCLSDWHYGMTCDNPWNKFDPDICRNRLSKLINEVIRW